MFFFQNLTAELFLLESPDDSYFPKSGGSTFLKTVGSHFSEICGNKITAYTQEGNYKFKALKGNSADSVGDVSTVEVLWESFGTKMKPEVGDLIIPALFKEGYVHFFYA